MDSNIVKYSDAKRIMIAAYKSREPVFLAGAPGCGKSALGWEIAKELTGKDPVDIRTTLIDPVDLRGIPTIDQNGQTHWATPDFLPTDGRVIILEELPNAPQSVQSACLQPVYDRCLGDWKMHPDAWIIGTGNRVQDRAGSGRLISSLRGRMLMLELQANLEDWLVWADSINIPMDIKQFLRFRPALFSAFAADDDASPTARGWHKVAKLVPNLPLDLRLPAISGLVGQGAAIELIAFLKIKDQLPDPKEVLATPEKAVIPDDPATMYALVGALVEVMDKVNINALMTYAIRLNKASKAEFSVLLVTEAMKKDQTGVCKAKSFNEWVTFNKNVIS